MSTQWTPATLAVVDDAYDRDRASDGQSRFGAYLRQHADRLNEDGAPLGRDEFAATVWLIATSPVMSPGYVRVRPDISAITPAWDEADGHLLVEVRVPLPHTALALGRATVPARWRDWHTEPGWESEEYRDWWEPSGDRPALLTTTKLRLPVDEGWHLPAPTATAGPALVADAKEAVAAVAAAVNRLAGPVVAALRGERL